MENLLVPWEFLLSIISAGPESPQSFFRISLTTFGSQTFAHPSRDAHSQHCQYFCTTWLFCVSSSHGVRPERSFRDLWCGYGGTVTPAKPGKHEALKDSDMRGTESSKERPWLTLPSLAPSAFLHLQTGTASFHIFLSLFAFWLSFPRFCRTLS